MGKKFVFCIALVSALMGSMDAFAENNDANLLALDNSKQDSLYNADDDIFAAMQALDEVSALLNESKAAPANDNTVDVDALLAAANAPQETLPTQDKAAKTAPVKEAKETKETPVVAAKVEAAESRHDIQTAPVKETKETKETPVVAAKVETPKKETNVVGDGTHLVKANTAKQVVVDPASAPHTLAMSYVMAIYRINGVDLSKVRAPMPTIAELYQHAFSNKLVYQSTRPAVGDLVFFHNTFDRNRDGRWNDWHSLVGIVESVDADETISVLIYQKDKIERIYLNLKYPELKKGKKGQVLNSQLRADEGAQKGTAAKLFAGFANLLGDIPSITVVDNWKPGMKLAKK